MRTCRFENFQSLKEKTENMENGGCWIHLWIAQTDNNNSLHGYIFQCDNKLRKQHAFVFPPHWGLISSLKSVGIKEDEVKYCYAVERKGRVLRRDRVVDLIWRKVESRYILRVYANTFSINRWEETCNTTLTLW
jgi:hypothetical protein